MIIQFLKARWEQAAAVVATIVGLVALVLGWLGVSRSTLTTQQIPYLASGAVFGLFALGVAGTLWITTYLKAEWRKLEELHLFLDEIESRRSAEEAATDRRSSIGPRSSRLTARRGDG